MKADILGMSVEDFVRESRIVMLAWHVKNLTNEDNKKEMQQIRLRASELIKIRTQVTQMQLGKDYKSAESHAVDSYYEMGSRYFRRYAALNWKIFLTEQSAKTYDKIVNEIQQLERVIIDLQPKIRKNDRQSLAQLGQHLMIKSRLEKILMLIEQEMLKMIDTDLFRIKLLPQVVEFYYNSYRAQRKLSPR